MQALTVIAEWLRAHWAWLAAVVFAAAIITTIAVLPLPIRKGVLAFLALVFITAAIALLWWTKPWESGHYSLTAVYIVAAVPALLAAVSGVWAWAIW